MNFADQLREISAEVVEEALGNLMKFLKLKAEDGSLTVKVSRSDVQKIVFGEKEQGPQNVFDETIECLRQEGVSVEIEYGARPGDKNWVTFSWA